MGRHTAGDCLRDGGRPSSKEREYSSSSTATCPCNTAETTYLTLVRIVRSCTYVCIYMYVCVYVCKCKIMANNMLEMYFSVHYYIDYDESH